MTDDDSGSNSNKGTVNKQQQLEQRQKLQTNQIWQLSEE